MATWREMEQGIKDITERVDSNFAAVVDCLGTHKEALDRIEGMVNSVTKQLGWAESNIYKLQDRIAALEAAPVVAIDAVPEAWVVLNHVRKPKSLFNRKSKIRTYPSPTFCVGDRVWHMHHEVGGTIIPRPDHSRFPATGPKGVYYLYMIDDGGRIYACYPQNVLRAA